MGLSSRELSVSFETSHATVNRFVAAAGGIRPQRWKDPDRLLTLEERFQIEEMVQEGASLRAIGKALGRAPSTISREIKRSVGDQPRTRYRPVAGHRQAVENRRRPKPLKIPSDPELLGDVQAGLDLKLSPEQIAGRLRREHPDEPRFHVSHETIYKTIYLQARGGLKRELQALTRTGRTIRWAKRRPDARQGRIKDMVSIWDRPVEALDRSIPGHWEGDLIVGENGGSAIGTVVERHSNYLILVWLDPSKNRTEATREGLVAKLEGLPETLKGTLTWDQGREMAQHQKVSEATGIEVFFADPHSPWQRATNENTNGLLRQYFPKGADLSSYSQADLDYVADQMNRRPRKRLGFATPYEVLSEHLLQ
ncbi:IS30 family transposase [Brachybacterium sp. YJGR34]|uniref:IS30 family transposase n=1 Tax=Brachybacterium sp. YJGR34 TaxID=2059911 RepID=UPI001E4E6AA4|nr:IS30 family transposase [Brachybacterium sp. YJGR34]